jgi:hypothetical protein
MTIDEVSQDVTGERLNLVIDEFYDGLGIK